MACRDCRIKILASVCLEIEDTFGLLRDNGLCGLGASREGVNLLGHLAYDLHGFDVFLGV